MGSHAWVCRDPVRREEFLACLRAKPRSTYLELAAKMNISRFAIKTFVALFEREGIVRSELDESRRSSPNAGVPRVAWLVTRRPPRIGKPKLVRGVCLAKSIPLVRGWPYAPTGTPIPETGTIHCFAVMGKQLPPIGWSKEERRP